MLKNNSSLMKIEFKKHLCELQKKHGEKIKSGILFKLGKNKSPLEILGVLNFLKFKIKKWGNINIYSYLGDLLKKNLGLIIGASDLENALSITIVVFLSDILNNEEEIHNLYEKLASSDDLEDFLRSKISKDLKKGYPIDPYLESQLKEHLENIIKN